jgi:hypothetical protein
MPDLTYRVIGVSAEARGLTPLLNFRLAITNAPADELIHAVILQAQIQIQSSQRSYSPQEKLKRADLFGPLNHGDRRCATSLGAFDCFGGRVRGNHRDHFASALYLRSERRRDEILQRVGRWNYFLALLI